MCGSRPVAPLRRSPGTGCTWPSRTTRFPSPAIYFASSTNAASRQEAYIEAHRRPGLVRSRNRFPDNEWGRQALVHGLVRYARDDAGRAADLWERYRDRFDFADYQRTHVRQNLALSAAREGEIPPSVDPTFAPAVIEGIADAALEAGELELARGWIEALPSEELTKVKWQYWLGRTRLDTGADVGMEGLRQLAKRRTYYGFLAAHDLGVEASMNEKRAGRETFRLATNPGVIRMTELYAVDDLSNARREWIQLTRQLGSGDEAALVEYLASMGWTDLAIIAANRADETDLLSVRFPTPFLEAYRKQAFQTGVPLNFLLAVSRQESAFNSSAISSAGARGLMQMMIGTAEITARNIRARKPTRSALLDPMVNIRLGSHHLAELLVRYDGNRALAAAAYNAGPHRVDRWIRNASGLPTTVWIEQIPFRETRNYVKNVIAFSQVYANRLGLEQPVWNVEERYVR